MKKTDLGEMTENKGEIMKDLFEVVIFYSPIWRIKWRKPRENKVEMHRGYQKSRWIEGSRKRDSMGKDWRGECAWSSLRTERIFFHETSSLNLLDFSSSLASAVLPEFSPYPGQAVCRGKTFKWKPCSLSCKLNLLNRIRFNRCLGCSLCKHSLAALWQTPLSTVATQFVPSHSSLASQALQLTARTL